MDTRKSHPQQFAARTSHGARYTS